MLDSDLRASANVDLDSMFGPLSDQFIGADFGDVRFAVEERQAIRAFIGADFIFEEHIRPAAAATYFIRPPFDHLPFSPGAGVLARASRGHQPQSCGSPSIPKNAPW